MKEKNYQEITSGTNSTLEDIVRSLMIILGVFYKKRKKMMYYL